MTAEPVLITEPEPSRRAALGNLLEREGYTIDVATDVPTALSRLAALPPSLVVLERDLPERDGLIFMQDLRNDTANTGLPVLMVSGHDGEGVRVECLDAGADDFLAVPCYPRELGARVRALLRRARQGGGPDTLVHGSISIDLAGHRAFRDGRELNLTPREFQLLRFFLERPGRVFDRDTILDAVWGASIHVQPRTVDVHVRRLRQALRAEGESDPIRTVWAGGYALERVSDTAAPARGGRTPATESAVA